MEGNKTPARRTRRTASATAAPASPRKSPAKRKVAKPKAPERNDVATSLTPAERLRMIELAAFFRAERRGFAPGHEFEDWLAAEAEIAALVPAPAAAKTPARRARKSPAN
jgi:Protein of unknown function (DUF2934)